MPRWFVVLFTIEFTVALGFSLFQGKWAWVVYFLGAVILNIGILMGFEK